MPRHREVSVKVWDDDAFLALSRPAANAQTLWLRLLCGPETTPIPGVIRAGRASLAEGLEWSVEDLDRCWQEIADAGLAVSDWKARLIFLPNAFRHRGPKGIPDVCGWRRVFSELPDCAVRTQIGEAVTAALSHCHKGIRAAWASDPTSAKAARQAGRQSGPQAGAKTGRQTGRQAGVQTGTQPKPQPLHEEEGEEGEEDQKPTACASGARGGLSTPSRDPDTGYVRGSAITRPAGRGGLVSGAPASAVFACAAFHVPAFLHAEFRGKLTNAGEADPEVALGTWYRRLRDTVAGQDVPADNVRWLRARYDAWRQPDAGHVGATSVLDDPALAADVARTKRLLGEDWDTAPATRRSAS